MQTRKLGNSPLDVAPLAFGGNVFGWTIDQAASCKILDAFVSAGLNFIDTADIYSRWKPGNQGGESETIIGNWLKQSGQRDKVLIATKVGLEMGPGKKGLSRSWIFSAVEDSLKRLQTDRIDLYQSHVDDPATPLEETLGAFAELIEQGKVRAIGASNFTASRLAESIRVSRENGWPAYQSLQPCYNLCERAEFEKDLEPLCLKEDIGVISYYSLARGFLSGKYRSEKDSGKSVRGESAKKYLNEHGFRVLAAVDNVARRFNSTPARVAIAWLIARPSITAPIASATNLDQLNDLVEATKLKMDRGAIEELDKASA
jgi:aryl-alcohol dehydrogenase-like predicted oxidoreductase